MIGRLVSRCPVTLLCPCRTPSVPLPYPYRCVSGDRGGNAIAFDLTTAQPIGSLKGHKGHITAVEWLCHDDEPLFLTGAQDGHVRVWDLRVRQEVANVAAHTGEKGSGAVGALKSAAGPAGSCAILSSGADCKVCVLDPKMGFNVRTRFAEHKDFPYSLHVAGNMAFSGAGDGMLLAYDLATDSLCWGLAANRAAVRGIGATASKLVASGDDGRAIVYDF